MDEPSGWVWYRQARSDHVAAEHVLKRDQPQSYCQAIAKYQQTVEKSVKALAASLEEDGRMAVHIGFSHGTDRLVSALVHAARSRKNRDVGAVINALFHEANRGAIRAISALAPRRPAPGKRYALNTEYPYQTADGRWHAPADAGSFELTRDLDRFRSLAHRIFDGCGQLMSAVARQPRGRVSR